MPYNRDDIVLPDGVQAANAWQSKLVADAHDMPMETLLKWLGVIPAGQCKVDLRSVFNRRKMDALKLRLNRSNDV